MDKGYTYVFGEGPTPARFLVVGEAPGAQEDEEGRPFWGQSGKLLRKTLREIGVRTRDVHYHNSVCCRPGKGNPTPRMKWRRQCRDVCMARKLTQVQPQAIICVGKSPLQSFTDDGQLALVRNRRKVYYYTCCNDCGVMARFSEDDGLWACPRNGHHDLIDIPVVATWHPAYILRDPSAEEWWEADLHSYMVENAWDKELYEPKYRKLDSLPPSIDKETDLVVDVETTGLKPWEGHSLRSIGVGRSSGHIDVLTGHLFREMSRLVHNPKLTITGHNLTFDLMWGLDHREIPQCSTLDTLYEHYLVDERYPVRGLKHLGLCYTPFDPQDLPKGGIDSPIEEVVPYNASDVGINRMVRDAVLEEQVDLGLDVKRVRELYGRIIPILAGMRYTGIQIDREILENCKETEREKLEEVLVKMKKVYQDNIPLEAMDCPECGGEGVVHVNSTSPTQEDYESYEAKCIVCNGEGYWWQEIPWDESLFDRHHDLSDFLYKSLGIPVPNMKDNRRKDGRGSTRKGVLQIINDKGLDDSGFIDLLFEYRSVKTNYRNYVLDVLEHLDGEDKVHPNYILAHREDLYSPQGTVTGRISVKRPAAQNIPGGHPMRDAFVPHAGDCGLAEADLAQAELTVLAQISKDENLCRIINEGEDIHQWMVDMIYDETGVEIKRRTAKVFNFGILYGIGAGGIESQTGIDKETGRRFIDLWFNRFPEVRSLKEEVEYQVIRRGWIEAPSGRRRNFSYGLQKWTDEGQKAMRQGFNFIIQSMANDVNFSFLKLWCDKGHHHHSFPVLVKHDSNLFSCRNLVETLDSIYEVYYTGFQSAVEKLFGEELVVPIRGDVKVGPTWGQMVGEVGDLEDSGSEGSLSRFSTAGEEMYIDEALIQWLADQNLGESA